jgi:alanyl-tRNA synthetase
MTVGSGTVVTYPAGDVTSTGTVVHVAALPDGRAAVVLDRTAFHPVDTAWPDQPADRGELRIGDRRIPIRDAVVGAVRDGEMLLGEAVPVRTGTEGWTFVVAHLIADDALAGGAVAEGQVADVVVDAEYRAALSAGHTACHLASLALDEALAEAWRKDVPTDALGAPAFDSLAISQSRIVEDGSRDVYRIGKSLRRKGFDPAALDDTDALAIRVNARLAGWLAAGGAVHIDRDGETLADRRTWVCGLPDGEARIPCGGTHVVALSELGEVSVAFDLEAVDGGLELVMTTATRRTPAAAAS